VTRLSYCGEQVRRLDNDRFVCTLFAPPAEREGLLALYALNLELASIPERVGEPLVRQIRLQWWRDAIAAVYEGSPPRHPVATAVAEAADRFGLARADFDRLLDGRSLDLEGEAPAELAALVAYADATSGSLARLALQVLATADEESLLAAGEVGVAWALVGLVRAVPFHRRARRLSLPASLGRDAGLDAEAMFAHGRVAGLAAVVERIAAAARDHLQAARGRRGSIGKRALPALLPATLADLYLERLRRAGFDPFDPRVQHAGAGRLVRLAAQALRGRF
jgi:phytoene synthase